MDSLPNVVFKSIHNYLPWRDRLAIRRISTSFRTVPCEPISTYCFTVQEEMNTFIFMLKFQRNGGEKHIVEVHNVMQDTDFVFKSFKMEEEGMSVYNTTINCGSMRYHRTIDIYFNHFLSQFFIKKFQLINLSSHYLARFRQILHLTAPDLDWKQGRHWLELYTTNNIILKEERKLLNYCKNPHLLKYSPPTEFKVPEDFWQITAMRKSSQLVLVFGDDINDTAIQSEVDGIDVRIDDTFLQTLMHEGKHTLILNTKANITITCIMEYIEKALTGNAMLTLAFYHTFGASAGHLRWWLLNSGFLKIGPNKFAKNIDSPTMDGHDPDRIIAQITNSWIDITSDMAKYRGPQSTEEPNNPFLG